MSNLELTDETTPDELAVYLKSRHVPQSELNEAFFISLVKNKLDCSAVLLEYGAELETKRNGNDEIFAALDPDSSFLFSFNLTPLMVASKLGYIKFVKFLVDNGADVNAAETFGKTSLMIAILNGNTECAIHLIENGSDVEKMDNIGMNPLNLAAERGLDKVVTILMSKGCAVNHLNKSQYNALHFASAAGQSSTVKCFLENGVNADIQNVDGCNPLFLAIQNGHGETALILVESTSDLNATDRNGDTALICAARKGLENVVKALVKKGCNVDVENNFGDRALHLALQFGYFDIARCLVDNGVDIKSGDNRCNPLMICLEKREMNLAKYLIAKDANLGGAILLASVMNMVDMVRLLIDKNCDLNVTTTSEGATALHLAARGGYVEIVDMLIDAGINIDARDNNGKTALMQAVSEGKINTVYSLVYSGCDLDILSKDGVTALAIAAESGRPACTRFLIENGADLNLKGEMGSAVPLWFALETGHKKCAEILIDNKCSLDETGPRYQPLLFCAIMNKYDDIVKKMIENGCDINKTSPGNVSAVHVAFQESNIEMAKFLIEKGADTNLQDDRGNSVLISAVKASPVHWEDEFRAAFELLFINGCKVNNSNVLKESALHHAACRSVEVVQLCLENGSEVNLKNNKGTTALYESIRYGYLDNTLWLLKYGADPNDFGEQNSNFNDFLCNGRTKDFCKLLIRYGLKTDLLPDYHPYHPYRGLLANQLLDTTYCSESTEDLLNLIYLSGSASNNLLYTLLKDTTKASLWETSTRKRKWLEHVCSKPMTLLDMTRIVVRKNLRLKPTLVENIYKLNLPTRIKSFLDFEDV